MRNIILLGLDPFSENRGVGALSYSIIYLLDSWGRENGYELNIYIAVSKLSNPRKYNLSIGGIIIQIIEFPLIVNKGLTGYIKTLLSLFLSRKIILKSDYVLDMGQGDSFSDIYGERRFDLINNPKKVFRFFKKKQLILPQTIGPFIHEKILREARKSIEKSNMVLTRDRQSYDFVIKSTIQRNVVELIDVAFYMPYTKLEFHNNKINVGLNISSLMWHGGYTRDNQFGFNFDYQKITRTIINYFLSIPNVKLHLIPHVVSAQSTIENDYEVSRKIAAEYNNEDLVVSPFFLDPIDAKNYISGLNFFTGARMHACIASFSSGVPVYPIAYSRKFNGLFCDTLEYPYIGDLINQSEEDFINGLKEAFGKRDLLKSIIKDRLNTVIANRKILLFDRLNQFFEN